MAKYKVRIEGMTENQQSLIINSESESAKRIFRSQRPKMTENQKSLEGTIVRTTDDGGKIIKVLAAGRDQEGVKIFSEEIVENAEPETPDPVNEPETPSPVNEPENPEVPEVAG